MRSKVPSLAARGAMAHNPRRVSREPVETEVVLWIAERFFRMPPPARWRLPCRAAPRSRTSMISRPCSRRSQSVTTKRCSGCRSGFAGRKPPVNFVLVSEGEEEIGSPHFSQIVRRPEVLSALGRSLGIFMPAAAQGLDGQVTITLGAKGVIECELVSSGERWGRGPRQDSHSSNKARVDSPAWHLVEALATPVSPDGNDPAIENYADQARPISRAERAMVADAARRPDETAAKKQLGVEHWVRDVSWPDALERLVSRPTVNIGGLVGGYTGPGGKTILPHRAVAKLDLRLVPDMTAAESTATLTAHLAKRGFGDLEANVTGACDPTSTPADALVIKVQETVYRRSQCDPIVLPRNAGYWPV